MISVFLPAAIPGRICCEIRHCVPTNFVICYVFQSGAIMAILGMVCSQFPNAQLSIAFVGDIFPHSFSADSVSE